MLSEITQFLFEVLNNQAKYFDHTSDLILKANESTDEENDEQHQHEYLLNKKTSVTVIKLVHMFFKTLHDVDY
jgi:hypothetical protein